MLFRSTEDDGSHRHLQEIVDAFAVAGNPARPPGFHPTQGGWSCEMTRPLDPGLAAGFAAADPKLSYRDDELFCFHCWAVVIGEEARQRYYRDHLAVRRLP